MTSRDKAYWNGFIKAALAMGTYPAPMQQPIQKKKPFWEAHPLLTSGLLAGGGLAAGYGLDKALGPQVKPGVAPNPAPHVEAPSNGFMHAAENVSSGLNLADLGIQGTAAAGVGLNKITSGAAGRLLNRIPGGSAVGRAGALWNKPIPAAGRLSLGGLALAAPNAISGIQNVDSTGAKVVQGALPLAVQAMPGGTAVNLAVGGVNAATDFSLESQMKQVHDATRLGSDFQKLHYLFTHGAPEEVARYKAMLRAATADPNSAYNKAVQENLYPGFWKSLAQYNGGFAIGDKSRYGLELGPTRALVNRVTHEAFQP